MLITFTVEIRIFFCCFFLERGRGDRAHRPVDIKQVIAQG